MSDLTVRVLICDDHPVYRRGLRALLAEIEDIDVVGEAGDGEEALRLAADHRPDVVIMDLHLPGMSGIETTRKLLARQPDVGVVVLTMFEDDTSLVAALRVGARGYIVKGAGHDEISRAIYAVARGEAILGATMSARLAAAVGPHQTDRAFPNLTQREFEVLELLAHGLSNQQIADRLSVSPKTVRNNLSTVFSKLHVTSRTEAAAVAHDAGVASRPPRPTPPSGATEPPGP